MNTAVQYPTTAGIAVEEMTADKYLARLTDRVAAALGELYDLSVLEIDAVLSEALFQIAADIRAGRPVLLESLGDFVQVHVGRDCTAIRWRATPRLFEPLPQPQATPSHLAEALLATARRAGGVG